MTKLILHVAIIFLMIVRCKAGPKEKYIPWSETLNRLLLNIYYETYPPDEHHIERLKEKWDECLPEYSGISLQRLEGHLYNLRNNNWNLWQSRSGTEREQMEDNLANIYKYTNDGRPKHEERMLKELFRMHPDYQKEYELYRTLVYRWYERNVPLGKEIMAKDVDWTPQRKADLLHIDEQVRKEDGHIYIKNKQRWLRMHKNLNVNEKSLADYTYKLKRKDKFEPDMEEKLEAERKYRKLFVPGADKITDEIPRKKEKKVQWTEEMNADLLYIDEEVRKLGGNLAAVTKDRWDRMQKKYTHFSGWVLLARADFLHRNGHVTKPEHLQAAKERYEALPPISSQVLSGRTGRRKIRQISIHERHQDEPPSPSFELTPEQWASFQQDMEELNVSNPGYAYYPHHTLHYRSSSHTLIDQDTSGVLPDTPRPQFNQWYPGNRSGHTPTDQASSSIQPHFQNPYNYQLYPGSSSRNTLTDYASSSNQPYIPNLYDNQWHPGSSSNHTQHPPQ